MKTQLKNDFIDYINNKGYFGLDYRDDNTYPKNKQILDIYLKICNKLNILDKIEYVIDNNIEPMTIIYEQLCKDCENEKMPELIDDSFHVSKQAECLAINTLNNYVDIDLNSEMLKEFSKEIQINNINLYTDIENDLKKNPTLFNTTCSEDLERKIISLKTNILSFKHKNKLYPIYYGWLFESMMYNIIYDVLHPNDKITYSFYHDLDFHNVINDINKHIKEIPCLIDMDDKIVDEYKDLLHKDIDLLILDNKNNYNDIQKYLCQGLHDIINEQKHMDQEALINTYMFIQDMNTDIDDQELGYINYIYLFEEYIRIILINQINHLLFSYIKTKFSGDVIDIIRKPNYNYGYVKGEGDFILIIKTSIGLKHILVDSKCYSKINNESVLRFLYQLIGYRQLHRHKCLITSYEANNGYNIDGFVIINPTNEINRTLCFNAITIEDYKDEINKFADIYEIYLDKCIKANI